MRKKLPKILVTGAAGFIGSAFARLAVKKGYKITVVDKLTYAGDLARLAQIKGKYKFYKADISVPREMESVFRKERPEVVVNFAAESHVDRSIKDPSAFIKTNIAGTQILLDAAKKYGVAKFIHISTDEVYGDIKKGKFHEDSPLKPSSPYAASKAAADLLIKAYVRTFDFPAVIIRPSNNYGPWQYPEKLIPLSILKILRGEKIPVYARGKNIREWLYVEDCAKGILKIMQKGRKGEAYNLGSGAEKQNIQVVRALLKELNTPSDRICFVKDRPGHDIRYSLDRRKLIREIGWSPETEFSQGIKQTVGWSLGQKKWLLSKWAGVTRLYK
ncbi:MAG: dTDP-glucose 4,6-dehydratase [Candidatus Omnitrophica bacterium]|nr:dTDP-glucose 4,6-dehydratase [Candidatus Omnitrophota bacterium]MDD5236205.1 dTDP-glucose 4,6-dehydratase [Candidatus Omnitrophota bacterium]MDD5610164.1 dTDP-glucose 4,6-dehydratase [Candidatus Omnitrophota bacterium]